MSAKLPPSAAPGDVPAAGSAPATRAAPGVRTAPSSPRRRAREFVLQGLYQRQLAGNSPAAIRDHLAEATAFVRADQAYFDELWRGTTADYDALVERCAPLLDRRAADLSPIERAIIVIGAWELVHRLEIPYRVVINEAVELAKTYGATDGHKFVNGVLDRLAAVARAAEIEARALGTGTAAAETGTPAAGTGTASSGSDSAAATAGKSADVPND